MATYLDSILQAHRASAAADARDLGTLVEEARNCPPTRGFRRALEEASARELAVIAEIKRRSPSKGALNADLDPALVAKAYVAGGACCLSVLTDEEFFGGSAADLAVARAAVDVPVLRKDFTVSARDVCDARRMGADCVLLIVAALDQAQLRDFHTLALDVGLDVLVEVHDEGELERALDVGAGLIGVNQRDLVTFQVDHERAWRMAPKMPEGVVRVAESGVRGADDAHRLRQAGYHAVLVGEAVVTASDMSATVRSLRGARDD